MEEVKTPEFKNILNYKFSESFIKCLHRNKLIDEQESEGCIRSLQKIYKIQTIED
jgi:hypothetical protein